MSRKGLFAQGWAVRPAPGYERCKSAAGTQRAELVGKSTFGYFWCSFKSDSYSQGLASKKAMDGTPHRDQTQNTEHRTQNTEHRTPNTKHKNTSEARPTLWSPPTSAQQ
jgi:hypothetical protein